MHSTSTLSTSNFISRSTRQFCQTVHSNPVFPSFPVNSKLFQADPAGRKIAERPPSSGRLPTACRRDLVSRICPTGRNSRPFRIPRQWPFPQPLGARATLSVHSLPRPGCPGDRSHFFRSRGYREINTGVFQQSLCVVSLRFYRLRAEQRTVKADGFIKFFHSHMDMKSFHDRSSFGSQQCDGSMISISALYRRGYWQIRRGNSPSPCNGSTVVNSPSFSAFSCPQEFSRFTTANLSSGTGICSNHWPSATPKSVGVSSPPTRLIKLPLRLSTTRNIVRPNFMVFLSHTSSFLIQL